MRKLLAFYTKFFTVWVVLFGLWAFLQPGPYVWLAGAMKWFFALTMFGIGAVLKADDFRRIGRRPWIVLIGSAAQFTIMPFGAFAVAKLLGLSPLVSAGLILTGSAPGAMASNVMCYIGKADTAYSVSLTTVSTLLCPLLTPLLLLLLANQELPIKFWAIFFDLVLTVVVPVLAGFSLRYFLPRRIAKLDAVFPAISVTFIIFICSVVIALNQQRLLSQPEMLLAILTAVVLLNLYGMLAGYGTGKLFAFDASHRRTLCIEIGMQNAGLGTVLAIAYLGQEAALPAAMYVFTCIITASLLVEFWQRNKQKNHSN